MVGVQAGRHARQADEASGSAAPPRRRRTAATATCATTSTLRVRDRIASTDPREPSASAPPGPTRAICIAGTSPKIDAVSDRERQREGEHRRAEVQIRNARQRRRIDRHHQPLTRDGDGQAQRRADRPRAACDSVSSWRTIRKRLAPSATRTASSRRRASPRASSRLATLAHAISSTRPTAPTQHEQHRPRRSEQLVAQRPHVDAEIALVVLVRILPLERLDDRGPCPRAPPRGRRRAAAAPTAPR